MHSLVCLCRFLVIQVIVVYGDKKESDWTSLIFVMMFHLFMEARFHHKEKKKDP